MREGVYTPAAVSVSFIVLLLVIVIVLAPCPSIRGNLRGNLKENENEYDNENDLAQLKSLFRKNSVDNAVAFPKTLP